MGLVPNNHLHMIGSSGSEQVKPLPPQDNNNTMHNLSTAHISPRHTKSFKRADSHASSTSTSKSLMFLRRNSSASNLKALAAAHAVPARTPVRKDGSSVKSCFPALAGQESSVTSLESDDATPPKNRRQSKVSFTHISIREYCLECGDNPSVLCGPPVSLGWNYNKKGKIDIESFEADKAIRGREECRRLSADEREQLLLTVGGHSHRRILNAQYETQLANQERWETINKLGGLGKTKYIRPKERLQILKESASRKLERAYKGTTTAKEQMKLWEDAQAKVQKEA